LEFYCSKFKVDFLRIDYLTGRATQYIYNHDQKSKYYSS
jgi:hypothetical protein